LLAPLVAGLAPTLLLPGGVAVPVALVAVVGTSLWLIVQLRPFEREDADLVDKLDMPSPLKRVVLRAIAIAAR
jgi:hypothetical protein